MIRTFKPEDLDDVMAIWLKANTEAHHFISRQYWEENYEQVKSMLPQADIVVYEKNGQNLGFIGLNNQFIEGLFVEPSEQSKGIGQALLDYAKRSKSSLMLHVYKNNRRAVHFYYKNGFCITSEQVDENVAQVECVMKWQAL
ncbi:N-acetyltransferase [Alkalibacterium olivapovliticus]|uniref:Putative acetyltransferase n=1 Tax=Alkalibacterium olivapovliticus TaxID=99907 RepID=A0A2T0W843_9LACT|nr:N-acetyltransferase [Alkalibacterium olivapovliticus]PRY82850.1 putative acetyltransferase [Alkalibacterium olivapovliticus]